MGDPEISGAQVRRCKGHEPVIHLTPKAAVCRASCGCGAAKSHAATNPAGTPQACSKFQVAGNDSPAMLSSRPRFGVATAWLLRPHSPEPWKNRLGADMKVARTLAFCSVQLIAGGFCIFSQVVL